MRGLPTARISPIARVRTLTFGCKVNLTDTVRLENLLGRDSKYEILRNSDEIADFVVINTCSVTANADRDARKAIRRMNRENPKAKILVTGCFAGAQDNGLTDLPGVWQVVPVKEQGEIPRILGAIIPEEEKNLDFEAFGDRTRAFMKLQDGCNAYCSFCILPYVRGKSRSYPLPDLRAQASAYEKQGYREIVVTGTHVGSYGRDLEPRLKFSDALRAILEAAPETKIRVSSLEPTTLTRDLNRLFKSEERIQPHFHLPMQSGSDAVLKRMNRKCPVSKFRERVESLAKIRDLVSIGADVIVGFPGETEEEFRQTYDFIQSLPLTYLHVFPYSPRPETRASQWEDDVPRQTKKERGRLLRELGSRKRREFESLFEGKKTSILVEHRREAGDRLTGLNPSYVRVQFDGPDRLMGQEIEVRLEKRQKNGYLGSIFSVEIDSAAAL